MIVELSNHITKRYEKRGYITDEETEIVAYGLFSIISKLFYAIICIICGFIFDKTLESCIFYYSFLFIKKYAGGYHATSEHHCMIISSASILLSVFIIYLVDCYPIYTKFIFILTIVMVFMVTFFSPLENKEISLSDREKNNIKYIQYLE